MGLVLFVLTTVVGRVPSAKDRPSTRTTFTRSPLTRIRSNSLSAPASDHLPIIAIVGRPNVGKSTLFNRIVGSRRAIVGDEPGITRDRLYGEAQWRGQRLSIVDTGGIIPDDESLIPSAIFRQAKVALEEADAIIMVVDGRTRAHRAGSRSRAVAHPRRQTRVPRGEQDRYRKTAAPD